MYILFLLSNYCQCYLSWTENNNVVTYAAFTMAIFLLATPLRATVSIKFAFLEIKLFIIPNAYCLLIYFCFGVI